MANEVDEYIRNQKSPQKEICIELRRIIFETFPEIEESMRWGVPMYGMDTYYIGALKDSVNLGFKIEGLTKDELKLFNGSGKTMRHIKIKTLEEIDRAKVVELLKLVASKKYWRKG